MRTRLDFQYPWVLNKGIWWRLFRYDGTFCHIIMPLKGVEVPTDYLTTTAIVLKSDGTVRKDRYGVWK